MPLNAASTELTAFWQLFVPHHAASTELTAFWQLFVPHYVASTDLTAFGQLFMPLNAASTELTAFGSYSYHTTPLRSHAKKAPVPHHKVVLELFRPLYSFGTEQQLLAEPCQQNGFSN